jgi:hypothetical protein
LGSNAETCDLETLMSEIYSNQGQARVHMDKFGVKYETFKEGMLEPRMITRDNVDYIAFMNHGMLGIYDGANPQAIREYGFNGDGSENHKYYFKDRPDESKIHAFAKLLGSYNATYNKYGGLLYQVDAFVPTTQNYINMFRASRFENTEFVSNSIAAFADIALDFKDVYKQTNTLNVSFTGTYLSADIDISSWPLAWKYDLKYGSGLNETKTDYILLNAIINEMY